MVLSVAMTTRGESTIWGLLDLCSHEVFPITHAQFQESEPVTS